MTTTLDPQEARNSLGVTRTVATEVGCRLREAREQQGRTLPSIAARIKVRDHYLSSMEEGDWDSLPSGVNGRGLVRLYARELGIVVPEVEAKTERNSTQIEAAEIEVRTIPAGQKNVELAGRETSMPKIPLHRTPDSSMQGRFRRPQEDSRFSKAGLHAHQSAHASDAEDTEALDASKLELAGLLGLDLSVTENQPKSMATPVPTHSSPNTILTDIPQVSAASLASEMFGQIPEAQKKEPVQQRPKPQQPISQPVAFAPPQIQKNAETEPISSQTQTCAQPAQTRKDAETEGIISQPQANTQPTLSLVRDSVSQTKAPEPMAEKTEKRKESRKPRVTARVVQEELPIPELPPTPAEEGVVPARSLAPKIAEISSEMGINQGQNESVASAKRVPWTWILAAGIVAAAGAGYFLSTQRAQDNNSSTSTAHMPAHALGSGPEQGPASTEGVASTPAVPTAGAASAPAAVPTTGAASAPAVAPTAAPAVAEVATTQTPRQAAAEQMPTAAPAVATQAPVQVAATPAPAPQVAATVVPSAAPNATNTNALQAKTAAAETNAALPGIARTATLKILGRVGLNVKADGKQIFFGVREKGNFSVEFSKMADIYVEDGSKVVLSYTGWENHGNLGWPGRKRRIVLSAQPYQGRGRGAL